MVCASITDRVVLGVHLMTPSVILAVTKKTSKLVCASITYEVIVGVYIMLSGFMPSLSLQVLLHIAICGPFMKSCEYGS
jgi:hypothetical protein